MVFLGGVLKLTSSNQQFKSSELNVKENTERSRLMSQQHSTFNCPTTTTRNPIYTNPRSLEISWNSSQASWGKPIEPVSPDQKDAKVADKWSSVIQPLTVNEPCFDPYEPTNRTAQIYSDAYIPCTVRNTDFLSTVDNIWDSPDEVSLVPSKRLSDGSSKSELLLIGCLLQRGFHKLPDWVVKS
ncbi:hypothetical protein PHET_01096 [Paragonimus heterotremus]|uniref:Uncharacterized protein n=1 Tax=Paragonimus heterotremus TaxID=100268 RepID=A0A8J4WKN5_9TREM|nr:hypothetical protein PHET_01096 [Paragonimus heterotremus]